jgi:hypothetical protein
MEMRTFPLPCKKPKLELGIGRVSVPADRKEYPITNIQYPMSNERQEEHPTFNIERSMMN